MNLDLPWWQERLSPLAEDLRWLDEQAVESVAAATRHDGGYAWCGPGGPYSSLFIRDYLYVIESCPELFGADNIRGALVELLSLQRADGGLPTAFTPGSGGVPRYVTLSDDPEGTTDADNAPMAVKIADVWYRLSADREGLREIYPALVRAMGQVPRNAQGLVWIDPQRRHTGYGFTDQVYKTGAELFSSLLFWEACGMMSRFAEALGLKADAAGFRESMDRLVKGLECLWDEKAGAYMATSISDGVPDVWGNAYLCWLSVPVGAKLERVRRFLVKRYGDYAWHGQVRHLLRGDRWSRTLHDEVMAGRLPREEYPWLFAGKYSEGYYQFGAYWALPSGWVFEALRHLDPELAVEHVCDLVADFLVDGIYECVTADYSKGPAGYVASICPIVGALKRALGLDWSSPLREWEG